MPQALPIIRGLNPTRAQVPVTWTDSVRAADFVWHLVSSQRHRHPEDDEAAVAERFAHGAVVTDKGVPLGADDLLQPGTWINFYRRPAPERPVPGDLTVLHQDSNIVVVDKPPFLATLPRGQHITETAVTKARVALNNPELSPSHRLDRLTSGVLMFTASRAVRGAYQTMFDRRIPQKTYEALTPLVGEAPYEPLPGFADWTQWEPPSEDNPWRLEHCMIKIQGRLSTFVTDGPPNAVTLVTALGEEERVVGRQPDGSPLCRKVLVWTLKPLTGKTHQLRVALRSLGLPLINDPLYSEVTDKALTTPAGELPRPVFAEDEDFNHPLGLVAKVLEFDDPLTGEPRRFTSLR
ncbi:pseudouridylate synthase [Corynebacterium sp. 320]|nr:pseudouridylate synthase [Corynebacterium sp. 320]KAB1550577.1 pseudouridylate synthase [Corynebacterium sp. 321]KAB1550938.1 pseudouridylate synthase [Corynebacterium sp. 319]KAB3527007.1 pseudouridylate synthase [Corynebacterium sp. 250]KAB3538499.1 pseudouridylate synthase [Corynebacterium sp. 366]QNP92378.1 pseudouridylate synthase [Corynebacterium zhongnanshanii]